MDALDDHLDVATATVIIGLERRARGRGRWPIRLSGSSGYENPEGGFEVFLAGAVIPVPPDSWSNSSRVSSSGSCARSGGEQSPK